MSSHIISVDSARYSMLSHTQYIDTPLHSKHFHYTHSAKQFVFLMNIKEALKEIEIEDDDYHQTDEWDISERQ